jgi:Zn ribbon nucleic-acid-binding protein
MTQEWYFLDPEFALAKLEIKLVRSQPLKYNSGVFFMFFHCLRIYNNVFNEYHDKLVQLWHEDRVHEVHEVCRCIHQPKGHDKILIETISRCEGHLGYIFGTNLDLVIAGVEINFREHPGSR